MAARRWDTAQRLGAAAGRLALALALLAVCCGSGAGNVVHQHPHSSPSVRLPLSPLKSCEPLRDVPVEQLSLLRGHFQRYQTLARQIREMENYQSEPRCLCSTPMGLVALPPAARHHEPPHACPAHHHHQPLRRS
jgi:hypothetical protein